MTLAVEPHDAAWAVRFEHEAADLARVLAPWLHGGIHHVGSTAVPGLPAKPVIDMMAGVRDLDGARSAVEPLRAHGYAHAEHRPDALWFFKPGGGGFAARTHHLHLTVPGSDLWRERLAFRDALRRDPALRAEYAALKGVLAGEHTTAAAAYTSGKRPLVARVLREAGIELPER
jgi:GrpB-like predicted nucleotidyltransferase (UPF0157 family)